jgi:hypothetical protein
MSVPPFLSRDRITVEPDTHNHYSEKGHRREALLVVLPSDEAHWGLIRIGVLHLVYALKPLLQFQAQHRLPLSISNDRLRTARPGMAFVQTVELDALTVDLDLFRHKIFLNFRRGLLRLICAQPSCVTTLATPESQ